MLKYRYANQASYITIDDKRDNIYFDCFIAEQGWSMEPKEP